MRKNRIYSITLFIISLIAFVGCGDSSTDYVQNHKQMNLTIVLDLSDRISAKLHPHQASKDIAVITSVLEGFKKSIESKGAIYTQDKIRVVFFPAEQSMEIRKISEKLQIDFSKIDDKMAKRALFDTLVPLFQQSMSELYEIASHADKFAGSDLFSFFKYKVSDLCVSNDTNIVNSLVVITDGYMYHENAMFADKHRFSYLLPTSEHVSIFRNNQNWQKLFTTDNYGFLPINVNLSNLSILVAEVDPVQEHPDDFEIIAGYWSKWFLEMGVKPGYYKILRTEMPEITAQSVGKFLLDMHQRRKI